jgi:hypothetical protein
MDQIPSEIQETADKIVSKFTEGKQLQDIKNVVIDGLVNERRNEYIETLKSLNENN